MTTWQAIPRNGQLTGRHRQVARRAGFYWNSSAVAFTKEAEQRPAKMWGFIIKVHDPNKKELWVLE